MTLLDPHFIETRVLPIVIAFGLGVVIATTAEHGERESARVLLNEAIRASMACEQAYAAPIIATAYEVAP